jgi:hypothetical protein
MIGSIFAIGFVGSRFDSGPYDYGTVESKTFDPGKAWVDPEPKVEKTCDQGVCQFTYSTSYIYHERIRSWSVQTSRSEGDSHHSYDLFVPTEIWDAVKKGSDYLETGSESQDKPKEVKRPATEEEVQRYFAGELWLSEPQTSLLTSN